MIDPSTRQALALFREHGGTLRTRDALALGIHPRTLYRMRDEGVVVQVSRGIYRLAELPRLSAPDIVTVAMRVPEAVICLISALAMHEATDEVPHEVYVALPRGKKLPRLEHPPLRVFWFSGPTRTEGIEVMNVDGVDVPVYGLARTVADCFKFRNKIGVDVAVDGLKHALERGTVPADVLRFARIHRVEKVMMPYLEALQ